MKKIAMLLAMLLCLVPVLSACGANGSPEAAVEAALKVLYGDGEDEADYWEVAYNYNLDIIDLIKAEEEASELKKAIREAQKTKKDSLNLMEDIDDRMEDLEWEDYDFSYEITYCNVYDIKGDYFDTAMKAFKYLDTDIEDAVTAVALVGVTTTTSYTKDDEDFTNVDCDVITCFEIDGDWYVEG